MRKSNWIIYAILVIISAFLLYLWFALGFNQVDSPLDLILSILWWVLVVVGALVIRNRELARRRALRTCFVAPGMIFNSEKGEVSYEPGSDAVATISGILENLDYGFNVKEMPGESDKAEKPAWTYVVRSDKYEAASTEGEDPQWEGEVAWTDRPKQEPSRFTNIGELKAILSGSAFA